LGETTQHRLKRTAAVPFLGGRGLPEKAVIQASFASPAAAPEPFR